MRKIRIHPLYILFAFLLIISGKFWLFISYFLALIFHELAHFIVAKKLGYSLTKMVFMPYGVCLNYNTTFFHKTDELKIAIVAPLVNFIICFIVIAFWWIFPESYYFTQDFCLANFSLAVFNLLPCFPLDGGRVLASVLSEKLERVKAVRITYIFNFVFSLILLVLFIISIFTKINFGFIIIAIFLFSAIIEPKRYNDYNYMNLSAGSYRVTSRGSSVKIQAFSSDLPLFKLISCLSKTKFNVVYVVMKNGVTKVLTQNVIFELSEKFSLDETLENIINLVNYNK